MKNSPEFVQTFLSQAETLLKQGAVAEPQFSRGTYQVEVQEKKKKFYPFLQMKDGGELTDSFCTCPTSEEGKGCPHLAASYLKIFNGKEQPLHVRFQKSLWNRLFQMASKRHGDDTSCMKKQKEGYVCLSKTKKVLLSIEAKTAAAKKRLDAIIAKRVVETEETSLKFFNLSQEEIMSYREGRASHQLSYELSFWSDLAKWLMHLEEEGEKYAIGIEGAPIPNELSIVFPSIELWSYVPEVHWPWLLPALQGKKLSLEIVNLEEDAISAIVYDEKTRSLRIVHKTKEKGGEPEGILLGEWIYVAKRGFYRRRSSTILEGEEISAENMSKVLTLATKELQKFLPVFSEPKKCRYHLFFDREENLHIQLYVLEVGDLQNEKASCFVPWVYLPGRGFYLLEDWQFEEKDKIIPKKEVAEFINRHRVWLHQFPGFQTHLGSLESHLVYRFNAEGDLMFDAEINFPQENEEVLNFDEWVYIKGQGFYMKKESRGRLPLHPGLTVPKGEISQFISQHKEELEQVQGFFNPSRLLEKMGLSLTLNEEGQIVVEPKRDYVPGVDAGKVSAFGDYLYLAGKGFTEIPFLSRLPERFHHQTVIPESEEAAFLAYELEPLRPHLLEIDPRLQKSAYLKLKVTRITRDRKREWLVHAYYESDLGRLDLFSLWDAMQEKKKHYFSKAGLLFLRDLRFNWLRQLPKKKLDREKGVLRLNTLEWIRLSVFEDFQEPEGDDPDAVATRQLLQELKRLETHRLLDVTKLKATLRPYQEQGLHWLWFLYCHGLSGLLCDDMGLGKTHQAMALLASVSHEDPERNHKYLVVCPTSVLYHWQDLLQRFLPEMRVCVYHGLGRSQEDLEHFESRFDILLTSYGILRTGREDLRPLFFEVAIFDEIQIAKNHASQTHQALRMLRAQMRLGLSGTPIENRIRELKALIDLVLPGYLPSDALFRDLFIMPIEKEEDPEKKLLLGRLVKPFLLRRKKSEVLRDLPEKIEEIAYCDLSEEQNKLYREIALQSKNTYRDLKNEAKTTPYLHVFAILSKLKQVCDHPCLILGNPKDFAQHQSGKFELFMELLMEAKGSDQKVVVFSQFLDMIAIIEGYLKKKGIGYASIKGSTRDRSEQLRRFREDAGCEVFVASLLAAGVGIDLTVASIVIHYDRWWNPAKENQATDRVHRIGQNRGVQVFKLVTKHTVEEHIHQMIEKKKGLLEDIIGEEDQINYLNRDELLEVFEKMYTENKC